MPSCRPAPRPTTRVRVAGRIRAVRNSGMFIDLHDASGKIQVFSHKDHLSPEQLALVRLLDIGDLIGVEGLVRRTPRGELTVNATAIAMLAKSLRPLPEKYHGLADIELRYRQRYLDLIMNPQSRETLRRRSQIVAAMRAHLAGARLSRSRDADAAHDPRRRRGKAVRHASQCARHRALSAHRAGTAPEAAGGRRPRRQGVRDQPLLPQRGPVAAPQPGIHLARTLRGLCRLHRHDGADRGASSRMSPRRRPAAGGSAMAAPRST